MTSTLVQKMRFLATALSILIFLGVCHAGEPKVTISKRPEWQKSVLDKVTFGAETKGIDELLGKKVDRPNRFWSGFVIFSCTANENLGKRLLWVNAEVEFSNGYKRKFDGVSFHILTKGTEHNIAKIPFEVEESVSVKSINITSVAIK